MRHRPVLDAGFGDVEGQALAGPQVERDPLPAPVVDEELHGDESLGRRVGVDPLLAPVARHLLRSDQAGRVLAALDELVDAARLETADGFQYIGFLVAQLVRRERHRRLHGDQAEDLEEVILHHVAERAGPLVIAAPSLDPDLLGDGDLHAVDVAAVPERFLHRVGEAEGEDVLHRLLAQIVIDTVDLRLGEAFGQKDVQIVGGVVVVPERLLADEPGVLAIVGEADVPQVLGDHPHDGGRGRQIEDPVGGGAPSFVEIGELLRQGLVGCRVAEVGLIVGDVGGEAPPGLVLRLPPPAELVDARFQVGGEVGGGDDAVQGDHLEAVGQALVEPEIVEGGDELPPGEVAAAAEDDEGRGAYGCGHSGVLPLR